MWRLTDESGQSSSYVRADDDPLVIVNLSVWRSPDDLYDFVFRTAHTAFLRRRREWFERMAEAFLVCWWVPAGHEPTSTKHSIASPCCAATASSDDAFTLRATAPSSSRLAGRRATAAAATRARSRRPG